MKTPRFTTELKVTILDQKNVKFEFPEFETNVVLHRGTHINSVSNWGRFVPHGNTKRTVTYNFDVNASATIEHMINMPDNDKYNGIKYRLIISGNFGKRGYCSTGDMRITKEMFDKLAFNGEKVTFAVKTNRIQFRLNR